jgi:ADP-ribosylglycohydrolase
MSAKKVDRLNRARCSLEGLSVGDAFGERFFGSRTVAAGLIGSRTLPPPPWPYTDDTNMALSIVSILRQHGEIDQDELALSFAGHFDPARGYGLGARRLLRRVRQGDPWKETAQGMFGGQGSFGNGAAMRVAPLGAYFADVLDVVVENARRSAEVTHTHPEGIAGAIAVAVAAALAWQLRAASPRPDRQAFIDRVLPFIPHSIVRQQVTHARDLDENASLVVAVSALGNGSRISAQDTVPFVLWCAGERLDSYEDALWLTVSAGGDMDTTCAMVGGIVAAHTGIEGIPAQWIGNREPLPDWPFNE